MKEVRESKSLSTNGWPRLKEAMLSSLFLFEIGLEFSLILERAIEQAYTFFHLFYSIRESTTSWEVANVIIKKMKKKTQRKSKDENIYKWTTKLQESIISFRAH